MENGVTLYAEVRHRIGALHVVVLVGYRCSNKVHAEVHHDSIDIEIADDDDHGKITFPLPAAIQVNPKSCQGLHWVTGEGIHMRLQMVADSPQSVDDEDEANGSSVAMEMEALRQSNHIMFACVSCKGLLFASTRSFTRVLPLPSENWREMSSDWCCHSNEYTRSLGQSSLAPKEGDCLMSELYLMIHPTALDQKSVIIKHLSAQRSKVQCCGCRQVLGEAVHKGNNASTNADECNSWNSIETLHLYKHCIIVNNTKDPCVDSDSSHNISNIFRSYSLEAFLANHFVSLSRSQMSFKFIVESADDNQAVLLLWLLSCDTMLLTSGISAKTKSHLKQFHGSEDVTDEDSTARDDENTDVKYFRIAKILYQHHREESFASTLQVWQRDFGVETVRLPTHSCLQLLLLLTTSTQNTPGSLRSMEGFQVGYLRMTRDFSNET